MKEVKNPISKSMIKRLHVIYRACGINDDEKKALLSDLTDGRTDSTKNLTAAEAQYLAGYLNGQHVSVLEGSQKELKRMRSASLKRMQQIGINTTLWDRVNAFCSDKRICGKKFYQLDYDELVALVAKLEAIKKKQEG